VCLQASDVHWAGKLLRNVQGTPAPHRRAGMWSYLQRTRTPSASGGRDLLWCAGSSTRTPETWGVIALAFSALHLVRIDPIMRQLPYRDMPAFALFSSNLVQPMIKIYLKLCQVASARIPPRDYCVFLAIYGNFQFIGAGLRRLFFSRSSTQNQNTR
jgi:hypothetical protein